MDTSRGTHTHTNIIPSCIRHCIRYPDFYFPNRPTESIIIAAAAARCVIYYWKNVIFRRREMVEIVCVTMLIWKSADFWHRLIDLLMIEEDG